MRMVACGASLEATELDLPPPRENEILIAAEACGVCRTDLHVLDGELPDIHCPLTLGHEVVGTVIEAGPAVERFRPGDRVGVPWLAHTCGVCPYCRAGQENLCVAATYTGYTRDGGYAEKVLADARYCLPLPPGPAAELAPLLCAGLIGYRAYRAAGGAPSLGLYGFGAAAHLLVQVARFEGRRVFAFTRPGDRPAQRFALDLGAAWAGGSDERAPELLDAAILFAPVGALIPQALAAVRPGGRVVCAGIHMSDVPAFPYRLLWGERQICSVANLTRRDGAEFMALAGRLKLRARVERFPLADANQVLERLRAGEVTGAAVLEMPGSPSVAGTGARP